MGGVVSDNPEDQWRGWKKIVQVCGGLVSLGGGYCLAVGPRWFTDLLANSEGKGGLTEVLILDILFMSLISLYIAAGYGTRKDKMKAGYVAADAGSSLRE